MSFELAGLDRVKFGLELLLTVILRDILVLHE